MWPWGGVAQGGVAWGGVAKGGGKKILNDMLNIKMAEIKNVVQ